jgi:hypothetical protein
VGSVDQGRVDTEFAEDRFQLGNPFLQIPFGVPCRPRLSSRAVSFCPRLGYLFVEPLNFAGKVFDNKVGRLNDASGTGWPVGA